MTSERTALKAQCAAKVLSVLTAMAACSCASALGTRVPCSWLEASGPTGIVVSEKRAMGGQCGDAGQYRIGRLGYVLELWTGDSEHPELALRALGPGGQRLKVTGDRLFSPSQAQRLSMQRLRGPGAEYDSFLDLTGAVAPGKSAVSYPLRIDVAIFDGAGVQVGSETLLLTLRRGSHRIVEL